MPAPDLESGQKVAGEGSGKGVHELPELPPAELREGKTSGSEQIPLYAIDCIDISKDGVYELVNDVEALAKIDRPTDFNKRIVFCEKDYESLIENAPEDKLRILNVRKKIAETSRHMQELVGSAFFEYFSGFDIKPKEENYSNIWQPQELGQFQHFLRYRADIGATRFYECYDYYKEPSWLAALELAFELKCAPIAFAWKTTDESPSNLVAVILSSHTKFLGPDAKDADESEPNCLTRWLLTHRHVSATQHNDGTLQHCGHLFLIDLLLFLTERWMPWMRWFEKRRCKIDTEILAASLSLPNPESVLNGQISSLKPIITSMIDRIALLLRMLDLPTEIPCTADGASGLNLRAEELMMRSRFLTETMQNIEVLQSQKFNDDLVRSNREEARAVKRLTILASIFLPLSLSAGILSVNNRLVDIHLILWDFAGLGANLGALAILFVWIRKSFDRWGSNRGAGYNHLQSKTQKISGTIVVFVAVVAFNIGMFWNIQVGWKILAGGLACAFATSIILIGSILLVPRPATTQETMDMVEWFSDAPICQSVLKHTLKRIERERQRNQNVGIDDPFTN